MKPFFTSYHKCRLFGTRLLRGQSFLARVFTQNEFDYIKLSCFGSSTVPNEKVVNKRTISGNTACQQVVIMLLCYQVATRLSLTTCCQIVESQDDNKLLEQLVNKSVELNNLLASYQQQAGNKQCEHILLASCWNSIATILLQVCYNLCVFTCLP
jgi:hypothetical protein